MQIVFCCTGNTCRSPMAEYIFRELAQKAGLDIAVSSCGVMCSNGRPMSDNSLAALREIGIDGASHMSRSITLRDLVESDYIFTMTEGHAEYLRAYMNAGENVMSLGAKVGGGDVIDPYGGDIEAYRRCRDNIYEMVKILVEMLANEIKSEEKPDSK